MAKGVGVAGGILALIGAGGLFAFWWFVVGPILEINTWCGNWQNIYYWLIFYPTFVLGTPIITDPTTITLISQMGSIASYLQVMNSLNNGIFGIPMNYLILVLGDVGLIAIGAIMGLAASAED